MVVTPSVEPPTTASVATIIMALAMAGIAVIVIMVAAIVISEERDLDPTIQTPTIVLAVTIGIQIVLAQMQVVVTQQAVTHACSYAQANRPVLCLEARVVFEVVSVVVVTIMGKLLRLEGSVEDTSRVVTCPRRVHNAVEVDASLRVPVQEF